MKMRDRRREVDVEPQEGGRPEDRDPDHPRAVVGDIPKPEPLAERVAPKYQAATVIRP